MIASRRASAHAVALLLASAGALLPSSAIAATGGGGLGPSLSTPSPSLSTPSPSVSTRSTNQTPTANSSNVGVVQSGNVTVTASANGISLASRESAILRQQLRFTGSVPSTAAGQVIEIQRQGRQTGWTWANTAHARADSNGSFTVVWHTNHIGRFQFRAVIGGADAVRAAAASPSVTAIVYRQAIATQYGPGFYGNTTACGETLRTGTLGVANRTLPCGTMVSIYYSGRTIVVPVIDRGPYANHADWDLTEATGRVLGIPGIATIGAVSLPAQH